MKGKNKMNSKLNGLLLLGLLAAQVTSVVAKEKVVYGQDNRVFYANSKNEVYQSWARSTAVQIKNSRFEKNKSGHYELQDFRLSDFVGLCEGAKYTKELAVGNCSGFLVAPDLLVTAGHCVPSQYQCDNTIWAFDYRSDLLKKSLTLPKKNVYNCKKIIKTELNQFTRMDYAVIQLDRPVAGRTPLEYRQEGAVRLFDPLVLIGHPSGLPSMIADGAFVRGNNNLTFFTATTDSFGGNSGSPVINDNTGEVEGILVRGERDYYFDPQSSCYRVKRCESDACRGEDVTRITNVSEIYKK